MSQKAFMADFDALSHGAFADAGIADVGVYTPPGVDAVPVLGVRVMVDRAVQDAGDFRQVNVGRVEVSYWLADVTPVAKGVLVVDGDTFINDSEIDNDGSLSRWVVRRG